MARAQASDPLHAFRYHVVATGIAGGGPDPLQPAGASGVVGGDQSQAGFNSVGTPEYTLESAEYREGTRTYTMKFPGIPSTNEITMSRGVARGDTSFYGWVVSAIEGREYSTDLSIFHGTRESRSVPYNPSTDFSLQNSKTYTLFNVVPARVKISSDLDASSSDVSLAEIDVSFEYFTVRTPTI